jgi:putative toxin-antitoxin system antitoxin component (TIGR02293 family)
MKSDDAERHRILKRSEDTFGSSDKAMRWLLRRTRALGNKSPMELLESDSGVQQVEDLLDRIDQGHSG